MEKPRYTPSDFSDVFVKLKPIFGIKPGIYLSVIYIAIIGLVLFFALFYPGITSNGTYITFYSQPEKASVTVDDRYYGPTPITVFVKSGMRKIKISKPFYKQIETNEKVDGTIFASLLFPSKKNSNTLLEIENIEGLVSEAISDYSEVGMIKDFTFDYQLPQIMSETMEVCHSKGWNSAKFGQNLYDFLDNAKYFIDSEQELYEYIKAQSILSSSGKILCSGSLGKLVSDILRINKTYDNFIFWVLNSLPRSMIKTDKEEKNKFLLYKKIKQSKWFLKFEKLYFEEISSQSFQNLQGSGGSINLAGSQHVLIPSGKLVTGDTINLKNPDDISIELFPHKIDVARFYISVSEVTNGEFHRFTMENQEWLPSNMQVLLDKKLIAESYLKGWKNDKPADSDLNLPVSNVSYFAAKAYCAWLSKFAPPGYKVRLPYEAEWELIAKNNELDTQFSFPDANKKAPSQASSSKPDGLGIRNLYGNLWTWCEDWFLPAVYTLYNPEKGYTVSSTLTGSEKSVRGGSWANTRSDNIRPFTRGSLPPGFCNPYTGFRTVVSDR